MEAGLEDLKSAGGTRYYVVAFLCQQALYLEKRRESPGSTRSLLFLGKKLPAKLPENLRKPGPDFVIARYPTRHRVCPRNSTTGKPLRKG